MTAVGPAFSQTCNTSSNPPTAATTGTSQIQETRRRLRGRGEGVSPAAEPDSAIEGNPFVCTAGREGGFLR